MREHDLEALEAGRGHAPARETADVASPELAARAAATGRTEALAPAAVLRLQRAAGNAGVAAALDEQESPVRDVIGKGAGQPLEAPVRQRMEASFGADFSDVRVHAGGSAAASAQAVDAHAYTVGNEIVLGDGQTPGSPTHERTLAHELTHVVQQRSGPVDGTPTAGGHQRLEPVGPLRARSRGHRELRRRHGIRTRGGSRGRRRCDLGAARGSARRGGASRPSRSSGRRNPRRRSSRPSRSSGRRNPKRRSSRPSRSSASSARKRKSGSCCRRPDQSSSGARRRADPAGGPGARARHATTRGRSVPAPDGRRS